MKNKYSYFRRRARLARMKAQAVGNVKRAPARPAHKSSPMLRGLNVWFAVEFVATIALALIVYGVLPFGLRTCCVQSGSMEPALTQGSFAYVSACATYETGDIVAFSRGGTLVCHRIIAEQNGAFQTQGDANASPDSYFVDPSQVAGKVIGSVPYLGRLVSGLSRHRLRVLCGFAGVNALLLLIAFAKKRSLQKADQLKEVVA